MNVEDYNSNDEIAWCPGCGDFGILAAVKQSLAELDLKPHQVLLVSGIGQAAKLPHYVRANCFNGLHGRALPPATGAKIANRELEVIVTTGDGDCYGEGGNHFLHAIRRNPDITVLVHDNQVYGLTKGQPSPTTEMGYQSKITPGGVRLEPFKSLAIAIAAGCGFVARGFSGKKDHLVKMITRAVRHKGMALVDILQPCVTYNHHNTYAWYSKRVYDLNEDPAYNTSNKLWAIEKALEWGDHIPIGILYREEKPTFEEKSGIDKLPPLVEEHIDNIDVSQLLDNFV